MMISLRSLRLVLARLLCVALILLAGGLPVHAVQPDEILKDPKLEERARKLSAELRCVVCQNQSIDDSDAPLAKDLRVLVRERLKAGDTDSQIMDYVVARYGEFVLLRPRFGWHTALLWLAPLLVLAGGIMLARQVLVGQSPASAGTVPSAVPLSEEERRRLAEIIAEPDAVSAEPTSKSGSPADGDDGPRRGTS